MIKNIFEYASRNKLRFISTRGDLTSEQLWDVPLRSNDRFNLNEIAKYASAQVKGLEEENFVEKQRTTRHTEAETALEIVKHVINVKIEAEVVAAKRIENKRKKERLIAVLEEKQVGKLSELSERELKKQIAELSAE